MVAKTPPYDYEWTWQWNSGDPDDLKTSATRSSGRMHHSVITGHAECSAYGQTAIGFYYRPPRNGILVFNAVPAINAIWGTSCMWSHAHVDGWIHLFVNIHDASTNALKNTYMSPDPFLYIDDSSWSGTGIQYLNDSGHSLNGSIWVSNSEWYSIWVYAGGHSSGSGVDVFSFSGGESILTVNVPSFNYYLI